MKDEEKNKIEKLNEIYRQFMLDMATLRKERADILADFSSHLDEMKTSQIEKTLKSTI